MDAADKPTGMYLRRVSEQGRDHPAGADATRRNERVTPKKRELLNTAEWVDNGRTPPCYAACLK